LDRASRHTCREGHWFESSIAHEKILKIAVG
jgi:hypothetical protein